MQGDKRWEKNPHFANFLSGAVALLIPTTWEYFQRGAGSITRIHGVAIFFPSSSISLVILGVAFPVAAFFPFFLFYSLFFLADWDLCAFVFCVLCGQEAKFL